MSQTQNEINFSIAGILQSSTGIVLLPALVEFDVVAIFNDRLTYTAK